MGQFIGIHLQSGPLRAYTADPTGSDRAGGILLLHDMWGLNDHAKSVADRLAGQGYQLDVVLERTGREQEVAVPPELTALGLVSRLEYMLDRFEAELAEERRALAEAEARLAGYGPRLGEAFPLQVELDAKRAELEAVEAELAASAREDGAEASPAPVPAQAAE